MDEKKICPIFSLVGVIIKEPEIGECLELNCAMYDEERECCGLINQGSDKT